MGPVVEALADDVYRLRVVGSLAITLAYVAAARFDGMLSPRPARSVDVAAAQLIAREAGGERRLRRPRAGGRGRLGLEERYQVAAAHAPTVLRRWSRRSWR